MAFRRRSLAAIKNAAHRSLLAAAQGSVLNMPSHLEPVPKNPSHALTIQSLRTNPKDPDFHVLFFDTECVIVHLLTDKNLIPGIVNRGPMDMKARAAGASSSRSPKLTQRVVGFISKQIERNILEDSDEDDSDEEGQDFDSLHAPAGSGKRDPEKKGYKHLTLDQKHLTLDIAQLFMSCLHAWGLDHTLDEICLQKLGLLKPHSPVSFGLLSHGAHMSLMLPGWHRFPGKERSPRLSPDPSSMSAKEALQLKKRTQTPSPISEPQQYLGHWELSRAVTTQHLLSVISVANTLMGMNNASFIILSHLRKGKGSKK